MADYTDIKRKHDRFPVYSDGDGVKLVTEDRQPFSEGNWILTAEEDESVLRKKDPSETDRAFRRTERTSQEKMGQTVQQKEELKRHRENLPDYTKKHENEVKVSGKKQLFGEQKSHQQAIRNEPKQVISPSLKKEYSGRSYFVPKYIPASSIPDKEEKLVSDHELMQSMQKKDDQYLYFDTEISAFEQKREGSPAVQKFNVPEPEETIHMTRNQFKNVKKNNAGKTPILDRSLQGMIDEESADFDSNGYFH